MNRRLMTSFILIVILVATVFCFPEYLVALVICAVTVVGLLEFYNIVQERGYTPFKGYGIVFGLLLVLCSYLTDISDWFIFKMDNELIYFLLFITIAVLLIRHSFIKDKSSIIANSAITILGVLYVSFLFTFIIKIRYLPNPSEGMIWIAALFTITKISDAAAYILGSRYGKHKLIQRISAKKTIEGSVFGVLAALVAALAFKVFFLRDIGWIHMLILGVLLSVVGQIGDLVESLIKRDAAVKDSGTLLPGIGGVLDLMDSLLFTGPVMYIYLRFLLV